MASRCVERRVVAGEWPLWHSASVWRGALLASGRRPTPRESRPRLGRRCVAANWGIGERIHRLPIGLREAVCDGGRASHLYWAEQCEEKANLPVSSSVHHRAGRSARACDSSPSGTRV